jgi:prenyltransferase beta subunit
MRRLCLALLTVVLCLSPVFAQVPTPEESKATVAYVRGLQNDDGGFSPRKSTPSSLRATTGALRALKYFGGKPRDREACGRFVAGCFRKAQGGFADRPGESVTDVVTTSIGLLAVVELGLPGADYTEPALKYLGKHTRDFEQIRIAAAALESVGRKPPEAEQWRKMLEASRNPDGTFGKGDGTARDTGGAVVALLRLGAPVKNRDAVLRTLTAGQRRDGAWGKPGEKGSDLETSYRVMRCFHMLKEKPDVAGVRRFVARCRNGDGGYGVSPGQPSSASGTYFAAIILHWLDEK